ncbi:hypothetical protein BGZ80_005529, partial [Entomortierella chlamydospora]
LLPESLTSVNNYAIHQEAANQERARRLSEEENMATSKPPETLSLGRMAGVRYSRSSSNGSTVDMSPTTPTTTNPYGTLPVRTPRQVTPRLSVSGGSGIYTKPQHPDEAQPLSAQVQSPGLSKLPSPLSTISRSGTRSSPPNSQQSSRRSAFGSQEIDIQTIQNIQKAPRMSSPMDYSEDLYRTEREDQQPPRAMYHQQSMDREVPEWQDEEEQPRYQPLQQPKLRDSPPMHRRSSSEIQKEQHNLQRLRIQQQAREEVYGRGYGNGYADDPEYLDEFQNRPSRQTGGFQQRATQLSPTRDYFSSTARSGSGVMRNSPPVSTQTRYEHLRRPSRDGHSLMPAPKISPPLGAMSTTRPSPTMSGISSIGTSRRSLSDGRGSIVSAASARRLSNAATVGSSGYVSSLPTTTSYSAGGIGGGMTSPISHHTRSGSTGSVVGVTQRTSLYAPSAGLSAMGAGGRGLSNSDLNLPNVAPRRAVSAMVQPTSTIRRSSGGYGASTTSIPTSPGVRGSSLGVSGGSPLSSPEYARVFVPPRQSTVSNGYSAASNGYSAANGGYSAASNGYSGANNYNNINTRSQNLNDHDVYSYRPDVPARQSSLGIGSPNGISHRNSVATLRNGGGSVGSVGNGVLAGAAE